MKLPRFGEMGLKAWLQLLNFDKIAWTMPSRYWEFRKTIRQMLQRFMQARVIRGRGERMLQALMIRFISNNTVQLSKIVALYNGVQALMSGQISHFILPHFTLVDVLNHVQRHLDETQPHMTFSRFGSCLLLPSRQLQGVHKRQYVIFNYKCSSNKQSLFGTVSYVRPRKITNGNSRIT